MQKPFCKIFILQVRLEGLLQLPRNGFVGGCPVFWIKCAELFDVTEQHLAADLKRNRCCEIADGQVPLSSFHIGIRTRLIALGVLQLTLLISDHLTEVRNRE